MTRINSEEVLLFSEEVPLETTNTNEESTPDTPLSDDDNDVFNDLLASVNTPRMWTLSLLFAIFGSSINLFFSLRYPSVSISPIIALLIAHPLGQLWDQVFALPETDARNSQPHSPLSHNSPDESSPLFDPMRTSIDQDRSAIPKAKPSTLRRLRVWLAQGRWNAKEHCCVFISSNVSFGFAFATDVCQYTLRVAILTKPLFR
jgi:hypothetical protein